MNDKAFSRFLFIMIAAFAIWWIFLRRRARMTAPDVGQAYAGLPVTDPQLLTYEANPGAFGPKTAANTIDINVNGWNGINQNYMPLFGFVGMAQGSLYQ